jgi:16S rRNA processing protein RimM
MLPALFLSVSAPAVLMTQKDDLVLMAVIGAPHGVRGEVRAKTYTDDPLALGAYGALQDDAGRQYKVSTIRPAKNVVVMRLAGIDTREKAEALKGTSFYVARDLLPDGSLQDDEFFQADLVGLAVRDTSGRTYGEIQAVHNFGGGDILELAEVGKRSVMIPFSEAAVPQIDRTSGFVLVDPMAAGLDDAETPKGPGSRKRRPPAKPATRSGGAKS